MLLKTTHSRWCDSLTSVTRGVAMPPTFLYSTFVPERQTMYDELWSEIQDMPGEIFDLDIPELRDEKFDVNEYLNANYDY
jgi:hypothetical protein